MNLSTAQESLQVNHKLWYGYWAMTPRTRKMDNA